MGIEWTGNPIQWIADTFTLDGIAEGMPDFGVHLQRSSLRNLLVGLGIRPQTTGLHRASNRGRVGYYDPLVCWVILVAHMSPNDQKPYLRERLAAARKVARDAIRGLLAEEPEGLAGFSEDELLAWNRRVESTAFHLFISDVRHGVDPRLLHALLAEMPSLLNATLDSNLCLESVFRVYVANYARIYAGVEIDPNHVNLFSGSCDPLFKEAIRAGDTLGVLAQFKFLGPSGIRLVNMNGLDFDAPVHLGPEWW